MEAKAMLADGGLSQGRRRRVLRDDWKGGNQLGGGKNQRQLLASCQGLGAKTLYPLQFST